MEYIWDIMQTNTNCYLEILDMFSRQTLQKVEKHFHKHLLLHWKEKHWRIYSN